MATVSSYTSEKMDDISDSTIIDARLEGTDLILVPRGFATQPLVYPEINVGNVQGIQGIQGPVGEVTEAELAAAIASANHVDTLQLADGAVTTAKIEDDAVTDAKIGLPSTGSLASGAIRYARMGNIVHVWTTTATSGATLPSGFRPAATLRVPAMGPEGTEGPTTATVSITTTGIITVTEADGAPGYFSVSFSTV